MNTLIVDNIDSFTYNLVQCVGILGGNPTVLENTVSLKEVAKLIKEKNIDRIIISPGPKRPEDAGVSNELIRKFGSSIPILGVCLGHQCIGSVYGAEVRRAKTLLHGKVCEVAHDGTIPLARRRRRESARMSASQRAELRRRSDGSPA
jgi:anthranilate synthase/aminodeoxychorismate synthase-like glutamine amidotransferase